MLHALPRCSALRLRRDVSAILRGVVPSGAPTRPAYLSATAAGLREGLRTAAGLLRAAGLPDHAQAVERSADDLHADPLGVADVVTAAHFAALDAADPLEAVAQGGGSAGVAAGHALDVSAAAVEALNAAAIAAELLDDATGRGSRRGAGFGLARTSGLTIPVLMVQQARVIDRAAAEVAALGA